MRLGLMISALLITGTLFGQFTTEYTVIDSDTDGFEEELSEGAAFGRSAAGIGDVDGDGHHDLAVGAPEDDAIWIFLLDGEGEVESFQRIDAENGGLKGTPASQFGHSLAPLGDLDGDGIPDLAVGAPGESGSDTSEPQVWILFLEDDGTVKSEQEISASAGDFDGDISNGQQFGFSLANLGDLDDDGAPELAVGEPNAGTGSLWILFMNDDGTVASETELTVGLGRAVAGVGDVDGDGIEDAVVKYYGTIRVLNLDEDGSVLEFTALTEDDGRYVRGESLYGLGDFDNDGLPEFCIGNAHKLRMLSLSDDNTIQDSVLISETEGGFDWDFDNYSNFGLGIGLVSAPDSDDMVHLAIGAPSDGSAGSLYLAEMCQYALTLTEKLEATEFCAGDDLTLTIEADGGEAEMEYQWYFNGIPVAEATEANLTIESATADDSGTYSVLVTNGCRTETTTADVTSVDTRKIEVERDDDDPLTLTFSISTANLEVTSHDWDFGDGSTSSEESPTHTYDEGGQYSVSVDFETDCGVVQLTAQIAAGDVFLRGDADGNGHVNAVLDSDYVFAYLFGGTTPPCLRAADADGDDKVSLSDYVYLRNWAFLGGSPPPDPGPHDCGDDADSALSCAEPAAYCGLDPVDDVSIDNHLTISSNSGVIGGTAAVELTGDLAPDAWAFHFGVCHDELVSLEAEDIVDGADLTGSFLSTEVYDGGFAVACIGIVPGEDLQLYEISYTLEDSGTADLAFCEALGSPEVTVRVYAEDEKIPVAVGSTIEITESQEFLRGDADGSGDVFPAIDALFILEYGFTGGPAPLCLSAADVDGNNGVFPIVDALYLLAYGFSGGPTPPAPGPNECGVGPSANDDVDCSTGACPAP